MVFGGGRNSAIVSHADAQAATFGQEKPQGSPLKVLKRLGGKLKPHTAVTTTEEEPGVSDYDQAAGTSVPVASRAKANALNAGFEPPSWNRDDASSKGGRRSFSSFRSFRSRSNTKSEQSIPKARNTGKDSDNSPNFYGETTQKQAKHNLNPEQQKAMQVAQNPQDHIDDASWNQSATVKLDKPKQSGIGKPKKPRIANTETFFQVSEDQARRQHLVQEHLEQLTKFRSKQPCSSPADETTNGTSNGQTNGDANGAATGFEQGGAVTERGSDKYVDGSSNGVVGGHVAQITESVSESASQSCADSMAESPEPGLLSNSAGSFVDAPETMLSLVGKTSSQPSAEAAGTLSPRNRFVIGESRASQSPAGRDESLMSKYSMERGFRNGDRPHQKSTLVDSRNESDADSKVDSSHAPSSISNYPGLQNQGGEDANQEREESDLLDDDYDENADGEGSKYPEISIPKGSVPGLGIGDDDPRLPGERRQVKKDPKPSEDLKTENAKKRWLSKKEDVQMKRERQAEYAGWRQIGGWERRNRETDREEAEDLLQRSTFLETYVSDKYLGDWYQNTAIIVVTAFSAWVLGRMQFSVSWISLVLLFAATAYRTSIRRMRRNYRDDLLRESLLERRNDKDSESMEWLNSFMIKFWLIYEPSLSQMITEIGNEVLNDSTPGFIHSMKIDKFTLGTKAPRIDFVRSFPRTNAHVVVIDMGASFTPNDTMDLTARQLQTKVNPKIQLGVRVGKGFLTKNFPILLEDMSFKGKFRLRFKLMERFPHFQTLDFSFLSPPEFDFSLKPIGGDKFGFDINIIPGLSKFIKDTVNANLGPMMYAPNAFQVNIEQLMAGVGVSSGIGVLSLQIISASGLKRDADGRVDPYVAVMSKNKKVLAHTKIKSNTTSPIWNETLHVIVTNTNDDILLEIFDFDDYAPDRSVGQAPIKIDELSGYEVSDAKIFSGGYNTGRLKYIASYAPVTMSAGNDMEKGISPRDTKSGILNLKIGACRDLDPSRSKTAKLSPFAEIEFSGRLIDSTKIAKDTNDPEWNYGGEHIVLDKMSTLLILRVRDKRAKFASNPQVGLFKMKLGQLLVEAEKGNVWFPLAEGEGEIKIEPQWKPANVSLGGSTNNYIEPVGVIRLTIKNAKNLRNLEHLGKIDPYARVFVGHRLVARTDWFKNELNPVWNETLYLPIQNELQSMTIEVMDVENHAKDRSLGAFKVELQNMIKQDEDGNYKVFVSDQVFMNKLMLPNRGPKGTLEYALEFYPAIPVVSPKERDRMRSDRKCIEILKKKVEDQNGDAKKALTDEELRELASREERLDCSGVDMPIDEVLTYAAGVFAIGIVSLEGHHIGQSLRVIANNQPYPIFTSPVFKNAKRYCSEECPDFVSGQMNLSSIRFELETSNTKSGLSGLLDVGDDGDNDYSSRDPNAGELTVPCFELIREASIYPKVYKMGNGAKIELQARFLPLPGLVIDDDERIDDTGCIEIELQRAEGVPVADRSGLSDPYCAFYMNNDGERLYKSRIKKGTLDPVWNEGFRFAVKDVKRSFVKAIVNDWDMGNRDDFLGGYKFEFKDLEPLVWKSYEVPLENIKKTREIKHLKGTEGTLYLRMRFLPGHLQKLGDGYLLGTASVARAAGTLAHVRRDPTGIFGTGLGAAGGIVGVAAAGPHALLNKLTHHGQNKQANNDGSMKPYSAQIESITGLVEIKGDIQIRLFVIEIEGEREIYRTGNIKVENGEATPNDSANFLARPDSELGVKVLIVKSLGRHSDISQSSTDLKPGYKEVRITREAIVRITISQDE